MNLEKYPQKSQGALLAVQRLANVYIDDQEIFVEVARGLGIHILTSI